MHFQKQRKHYTAYYDNLQWIRGNFFRLLKDFPAPSAALFPIPLRLLSRRPGRSKSEYLLFDSEKHSFRPRRFPPLSLLRDLLRSLNSVFAP